jgi:hypothetical protein
MAMGEAIDGTASTVATWILLEHPGAWGRDALGGSTVPVAADGRTLQTLGEQVGARIVLIRRHGRHEAKNERVCFVAHTGPDDPWLRQIPLQHGRAVFDLDLSEILRGVPPAAGDPDPEPLFVTCTHGRRDPCCAERGRPVARALDRAIGPRSWEVTHIGGDRFAGNLVCFPHGMYFGRLDAESGVRTARAYAGGRIELDHYRGRSCYAFAVQSAEGFIRRRTGLTGVDDLRLVGATHVEPDVTEAVFEGPNGRTFVKRVRRRPADVARVLTCHGTRAVRPPTYEQVEHSIGG